CRGFLDGEFGPVGDRWEDRAGVGVGAWRFGVGHPPSAGVGRVEPFWEAYRRAGGCPVDPERVFYWEVLGNLAWAVGALGQRERHLSGEEPSVELASLGRICAEMELELLNLLGHG